MHQNKPSRESIFCDRVGCWWIKRALFVLKFLLKSGQILTPSPYWPHPQYLLASPTAPTGLTHSPNWPHPQPLSKGRGEWYAFTTNTVRRIPTTFGLTSIPRKRRGSNTPCFIAMHIVFARHTTPLSPWRGAGGEAGCRVACCVACCVVWRVVLFFLFFFLLPLPLSSEYAEQVKEEVDEVEIKC